MALSKVNIKSDLYYSYFVVSGDKLIGKNYKIGEVDPEADTESLYEVANAITNISKTFEDGGSVQIQNKEEIIEGEV